MATHANIDIELLMLSIYHVENKAKALADSAKNKALIAAESAEIAKKEAEESAKEKYDTEKKTKEDLANKTKEFNEQVQTLKNKQLKLSCLFNKLNN